MITEEILLEKYNINKDMLETSGLSIEDLNDIANDFEKNKYDKYKKIMEEFIDEYLKDTKKANIHSYRSRVKDSEHLAVKIIRKKFDNFKKYKNLDISNYEKFVTDMVGIRCFLLFKSDWENFHNYIIKQFENCEDFYITDSLADFDENEKHYYFAEAPKVHIRTGDSREIYEKLLPPDCVIDKKIYRSVHYILKYKGIYLEIQVRTLFEEGWGEIDHEIVYPYHTDNEIFKEYTELLNRLSGLADEMGSFFYRLKKDEIGCQTSRKNEMMDEELAKQTSKFQEQNTKKEKGISSKSEIKDYSTPNSCLNLVLEE